ncbi:MAG: biotin/lipoyl-binding protein [Prevotellaceae bacterium]|jgi:biotin carboxyl carrier protein|nr:biotin/lipoyl-binding protein [Prevotellaceae bacterium]
MNKEIKNELVDFAVTARKYKTLLTPKYKLRKFWVNPNPMEVHSLIPGTVVDIFVKEGQFVKEGEPMLILEAMKMRNLITMPFSAKIKKIHIEKGIKIPKEALLVELEK